MAGYIGKSQGVTQVDGYTQSEADNKFIEGDDTLYVDETNNRVGIGTSSPNSTLHVVGQSQLIHDPNGSNTAQVFVGVGGASDNVYDADLHRFRDEGGSEAMRIDSSGNLLVGTTSQLETNAHLQVLQTANNTFAGYFRNDATTNSYGVGVDSQTGDNMYFYFNGAYKGRISTSASGTIYVTASDYRLKENAVDISDGITRVKQLQPKRFNFIADDSKTVDGFMAHEAKTVVPEAVTGEKDEVDDEGNPVYQGIDQSKLVPLLTAALQEAITKIETLETEMTSVKSRLDALEAV